MKKILIVLLVIAPGCASFEEITFSHPQHPRGDQTQYTADRKQCEHEATEHVQVANPRYGSLREKYDLERNLGVQCMEAKGYIKDTAIMPLRLRDPYF